MLKNPSESVSDKTGLFLYADYFNSEAGMFVILINTQKHRYVKIIITSMLDKFRNRKQLPYLYKHSNILGKEWIAKYF